MKYNVGDVVIIRRNLEDGRMYYGEDTRVSEFCCHEMTEFSGMEARIISEDKGFYRINLDGGQYKYVEGMFAGINTKAVLEDHEEYTSNKEVEALINKTLRLAPNQLINDALDKNDKERFKELSKKYYPEDSK